MNCPKCGSETVLQIRQHGKDGIAPFVCECGHKWNDKAATLFQRIKEAKSLEDIAEIFIYPHGWLWYTPFFGFSGFIGKENAIKYNVIQLKGLE